MSFLLRAFRKSLSLFSPLRRFHTRTVTKGLVSGRWVRDSVDVGAGTRREEQKH